MTSLVPSYDDELAVVNYLMNRLEERLSGRHQNEILHRLPTDYCQLGVLVPWSRSAEDSEDQSGEIGDELSSKEPNPDRDVPPATKSGSRPTSEDGGATPAIEPLSTIEDMSRRPPSSLGVVFKLLPPGDRNTPLEITVSTKFAFYTRHFPTFDEQRRELGTHDSNGDGSDTRRNVSLVEKCRRHQVEVSQIKFTLMSSDRSAQDDGGIVQKEVNKRLEEINNDPSIRKLFHGNQVVPITALQNEDSYDAFLSNLDGPSDLPPLKATLRLRAQPESSGNIRIELYLCNDTERDTERPMNDQYRILADASLSVCINRGELTPTELLPVPDDYQYDRRVYAIGRNVSAEVEADNKTIRTRALARFDQPRMTTTERVEAKYSELASQPYLVLKRIYEAMQGYAETWERQIIDENQLGLSPDEIAACRTDLAGFNEEIDGFASGVAALSSDSQLEKAFRHMNKAFSKGKYTRWRLFQLVFIVTQLPALAIREGITKGEWPKGNAREWNDCLSRADVLWFPTGGGKTEAYLGLVSCAALYDRLRGKLFGTTAWLRFPLRMLSVQQLQRAMKVLWDTEQERLAIASAMSPNTDMGDPISLGYLVGSTNTPNTYRDKWSFENLKKDQKLRERLLLISECPNCRSQQSVDIILDEKNRRVLHFCNECESVLPVYVSDEEVYRFLPSLVIGTVDKIAAIAYQPKLAALWAGPGWKCSIAEHGYGTDDWCVNDCPTNRNVNNPDRIRRTRLKPKDPSPTLHIQDELHLLQEDLGAFAGHYETMVRENEQSASSYPCKVIAATATISGYEHQSRHIYGVKTARRFPGRGYDLMDTFYTTAERIAVNQDSPPKTMRVYTAFKPPYLRSADAAALCAEIFHEAINELQADMYQAVVRLGLRDATTEEEVSSLLSYYSRTLTYVAKRDSGTRIKDKLERDSTDGTPLKPTPERPLNVEYLESTTTLRDIARTIKRAEAADPWKSDDYLDATVATDVISHGVDVDRYNLMVLERVSESIGGYIQVSSRSGRQHVGLVVAVLPRYSLRANSIYDRFSEFHRHLDRMVEPVPVNRFAKGAVDRSFPGILLGTIYGRHLRAMHGSQAQRLARVASALRQANGEPFTAPELFSELLHSYALGYELYDPSLESQMIQKLRELFDRFKLDIRNPSAKSLPEVFAQKPMTSLRDVDTAIPFNPNPDDVNWEDLQWFGIKRH